MGFPNTTGYNSLLVDCRELAPRTVSLTGDWAQGDDSKHDSHYKSYVLFRRVITTITGTSGL